MPDKHAILSASSAHRWLVCPPSALWELDFPDTTSEAAQEGTVAHAVAEEHLKKILAGKRPVTPASLKKNPLYAPIMEEYVAVYVDYIMSKYNAVIEEKPLLLTETRVNYGKYADGGFGTADCIMITNRHMDIFDFKYGKSVFVQVRGNPQLMLYALGALEQFDIFDDIDEVEMHIIQPRMENVASTTLTKEQLLFFGTEFVRPLADLAIKGEGVRQAGEHCLFCKARHRCPEYATYNVKTAEDLRYDGDRERRPDELSDRDIATILTKIDGLVHWANSIKKYALEEAVTNRIQFPGFKVVEGRSNRKITDTRKAQILLEDEGYTNILTLKGLGELEELVGKAKLAEILGDTLVKPRGKPTLVPDEDPREPLNLTNFEPIEEETEHA